MFPIYIYLKKDNNNKGLETGTHQKYKRNFCSSAKSQLEHLEQTFNIKHLAAFARYTARIPYQNVSTDTIK